MVGVYVEVDISSFTKLVNAYLHFFLGIGGLLNWKLCSMKKSVVSFYLILMYQRKHCLYDESNRMWDGVFEH